MDQDNSRITTIYCEDKFLAQEGGWGWPFYHHISRSGTHRFETDIYRLPPSGQILFFGLSQEAAVFAERHQSDFSVILPAFHEEPMAEYDDFLAKARSVLILGAKASHPSFTGMPAIRGITDHSIPDKTVSYCYHQAPLSAGSFALLAPRDYLAIWDYLISKRLTPEKITVFTSVNVHIPPWFIDRLQSHGIALEHITYKSLPLEELRKHVLYRDEGVADYVDCLAFYHGIALHALGINTGASERQALAAESLITVAEILAIAEKAHADSDKKNTAGISPRKDTPRLINIVCHNPTYLFADLTQRFVEAGCVHSELPRPDAGSWIWLRPQEYIAFTDFLSGKTPKDVAASYHDLLKERVADYRDMKAQTWATNSIAIHHGICPEPIYQFDPLRNALAMSKIAAVAGVCPYESCYRQVAHLASRRNFTFIPIGYDHQRFTAGHVKKETKPPQSPLQIGFVGRSYGTRNRSLLDRSITATPHGYIKGGDHLVNIVLRLQARAVAFHLHIVGQDWEPHVAELESYKIPVTYYQRDTNISYEDYPSLFSSFDALLITSRGESGPVPALEAMSVGVPVVGCNSAGMVRFLGETTDACHTFSYDEKWHVMDYEPALAHLINLYNTETNYDRRLKTRSQVASYTTDDWVKKIMELSAATSKADIQIWTAAA